MITSVDHGGQRRDKQSDVSHGQVEAFGPRSAERFSFIRDGSAGVHDRLLCRDCRLAVWSEQ
jgi:hypothetical protein